MRKSRFSEEKIIRILRQVSMNTHLHDLREHPDLRPCPTVFWAFALVFFSVGVGAEVVLNRLCEGRDRRRDGAVSLARRPGSPC